MQGLEILPGISGACHGRTNADGGGVTFLDRLEKRFGWLAFPALLKGYAFLHVVVFVLQLLNKEVSSILDFDREKIMAGEVWRAFTFLFAYSGFGNSGAFAALFFVFMVMIVMMMSDALEAVWGVFRTSMFCYAGMILLSGANFLFGPQVPASGVLFYGSVFFAFATLYPRMEFRLMFFLPVQVRWIAIVQAALMLFSAISSPVLAAYFLLANLNYLLWAGIPAMRRQLPRGTMAMPVVKRNEERAFHHCSVCGKTEIADPEAQFRVGADGAEYCEEHQPGGAG